MKKFKMTQLENVMYAKRNLVDYIWKSANLEGVMLTFPETDSIYNGFISQGISVSDFLLVNNLKRAWSFIFDTIDYPLDFDYVTYLHGKIGLDIIHKPGVVRETGVEIRGTNWKPEIPNLSKILKDFKAIEVIADPTDRALTLMCYLMRQQVFHDGNKRTAMMAANQILIQNGCGIVSIAQEQQSEFFDRLLAYYETGNMEPLKKFLYEHALEGTDFEPASAEEIERVKAVNQKFDELIEKKRTEALEQLFREGISTKEALGSVADEQK